MFILYLHGVRIQNSGVHTSIFHTDISWAVAGIKETRNAHEILVGKTFRGVTTWEDSIILRCI
jgi:hypothetical protein